MKFSDLGITITRDSFTDPKISINDVLNIEIKVLGFKKDVNTQNGMRHLIRIEIENQTRVFFTSASQLIAVLSHEKVQFPFTTIIKSFKIGDKRGYEFT